MAKIIKIEKCAQCQYKNHRGGFGAIMYVPYCSKKQLTLPYTKHFNGDMVVARQTDEIPDWCPLEEYTTPTESQTSEVAKREDGD